MFIRSFILFLCLASLLRSQSALVSGPVKLSLDGRDIPLRLEPAALSPRLTAVVALDTFQPADLEGLRAFLLKLSASKSFSSTLFYAGGFQPLGPYRNMQAMEKDLKVRLKIPEDKPLEDPLRFFTSLLGAPTPPAEEGWSTVVYAGRFPAIPEPIRDYAQAWLARSFAARRIRPIFWTPDGPPILTNLSRQFRALLEPDETELIQASWRPPRLADGFHLLPATLSEPNQPDLTIFEFAQDPEFLLPPLADYLRLRKAVATRLPLDQLTLALTINPRDPEGIRLAADLAIDLKDHSSAVRWLGLVTEEEPDSPQRWRQFANALYDRGPQLEAETALARAFQLNPEDPLLAERYGRVRLALRDVKGAMALFD
jgi:hypothetical protein